MTRQTLIDPNNSSSRRGASALSWRSLLQAEPAADALLGYLAYSDVVCWFVSALEAGNELHERFLHAKSDLHLENDVRVLHCAAAHGCMHAVYKTRTNAPCRKRTTRRVNTHERAYGGDSDRRAIMKWVSAFRPYSFPPEVMYEAVKHGDLQVVQWLHTTSEYDLDLAMQGAAKCGQLEIVQWLADAFDDALLVRRLRLLAIDVQLPLSDSLEMIAWTVRDSRDAASKVYTRYFATRQYFAPPTETNDPSRLLYDVPSFAAKQGDLELLQVLKETSSKYKWSFTGDAVKIAASKGHLEVIEWLIGVAGVENYDMVNVLRAAAKSDHLHVMKWFRAVDVERFDHYYKEVHAVHHGHLDIVQWHCALHPGTSWDARMLHLFATGGKWDTLKWLYAEDPHLPATSPMLVLAAIAGDLEAFKIVYSRLPSSAITNQVIELACGTGNLELVQFIVSTHGVASGAGIEAAIGSGHLDVAKWLVSTGLVSELRYDMSKVCAVDGHYDLVEWLLKDANSMFELEFMTREEYEETYDDAPISPFAWCTRIEDLVWRRRYMELILKYCPEKCMNADWVGTWAAQNGCTEILTRLTQIDYPFVFTKANLKRVLQRTKAGSVVKAFLEKHPEWLDAKILRWAATFHQLSLLRFILTHKHKFPAKKLKYSAHSVIATASRYGHLEILKWMHSDGADLWVVGEPHPWKSAITCAALGDHADVVWWLQEHGLIDPRMVVRAFRSAIRSESLRVLRWIRYNHRDLELSLGDVQSAIEHGHVRLLEWVRKQHPEMFKASEAVTTSVHKFIQKFKLPWSVSLAGNPAIDEGSVKRASSSESAATKHRKVGDDTLGVLSVLPRFRGR